MTDRNENRPGYKKTKVGWIPEEWDVTQLNQLVHEDAPICYGILKPGAYFENGVPVSKTPYFYHLTYLASYGVHIEKMTFNLRLFLKSEMKIPEDIQEQQAIVEVLKTADNEITHLQKKLKALEKQKRGLMQKLLTGEVRVKVDDINGKAAENS